MDQITHINLDDLHESPFNPRKVFNDAALQELAADIKAVGRVLQPLLVRPIVPPLFEGDPDGTAGHEIVFGHRRYRAARLAGLTHAPCMVRAMTDAEAKRAQISENLQRADVHPIEEAEGFQALIDDHGMTADQLAEQTGKSRSYVYGRLKLLAACPEIRRACLAGEIGAEVALLIARLRTDKLQQKALGYIKNDAHADMHDGGKASYRAVRRLLVEKFTLDLKTAMFDVQDATLLPDAGPCVTCPKRSANAPEYTDVVEGLTNRWGDVSTGSANACTDPDCYDEKKKAHLKREAAKLTAEGKVVVVGNAARNAISAHGEVKGAYVAVKDAKGEIHRARQAAQRDSKIAPPQIVLIQDPRTGKTVEAVKAAELVAAGVSTAGQASKGKSHQQQRDQQENEAKAARLTEENMALLERVRAAVPQRPRDALDLQMVAQIAIDGVLGWNAGLLLARLWDCVDKDDLRRKVGSMSTDDVTRLLIDCALVDNVKANPYRLDEKPETLLATAERYGVPLKASEPEAPKAPNPHLPAARAQPHAKAGAPGVKYRDPMTGQTWSGRGLKPKWLSVALDEGGKTLADFEAPTPPPAARAPDEAQPSAPAGHEAQSAGSADASQKDDAGSAGEEQTDDAGPAGGRDAQVGALEESEA